MTSDRTVRELAADVCLALIAQGVVVNNLNGITRVLAATGLSRVDLERASKRHGDRRGLATVPFSASFDFDPVPGPTRPTPVPLAEAVPEVRTVVHAHGPTEVGFFIDGRSPLIGQPCAECDVPFASGAEVVVSAFASHRECTR